MSDSLLTPEEIAQLITGINGDNADPKRTALAQKEITQLLTAIDPGYSKRVNHTEPLSQDEINQLLAAIEAGEA
jgi:flagellar motor switch protein FliM